MDQVESNPYSYDRPVTDPARFVGRSHLLRELTSALLEEQPSQSVALVGPGRIGKTSTLLRIEQRLLAPHGVALYADLGAVARTSVREALWPMAQSFRRSLEVQGFSAPEVSKSQLVLNAENAFQQLFWLPLHSTIGARKTVMLLDNVDQTLHRQTGENEGQSLLTYLNELARARQDSGVVVSTSIRPAAIDPDALAPLRISRSFRLVGLTPPETMKLLRLPGLYHVSADAVNYLYRLTLGHPGDLQRIGHALYERCRRFKIRQATIADVLGVLAHDVRGSELSGAVFVRRSTLKLDLGR
jgi:hypothetical protein